MAAGCLLRAALPQKEGKFIIEKARVSRGAECQQSYHSMPSTHAHCCRRLLGPVLVH